MKYTVVIMAIVMVVGFSLVGLLTTKHRTLVAKGGLVVNSYDNNGRVSFIATQAGCGMKAVFVVNGQEISPVKVMNHLSEFMNIAGIDQINEMQISSGEWTMTKTKTGDVDWFGCKLEKGMAIKYDGVIITWDDKIEDVISKMGATGKEIVKDSHNIIWDSVFK